MAVLDIGLTLRRPGITSSRRLRWATCPPAECVVLSQRHLPKNCVSNVLEEKVVQPTEGNAIADAHGDSIILKVPVR